ARRGARRRVVRRGAGLDVAEPGRELARPGRAYPLRARLRARPGAGPARAADARAARGGHRLSRAARADAAARPHPGRLGRGGPDLAPPPPPTPRSAPAPPRRPPRLGIVHHPRGGAAPPAHRTPRPP